MHKLAPKRRLFELEVNVSQDDIETLEKHIEDFALPAEKSIVQGEVIKIANETVFVRVKNTKSEGRIPLNEFALNGFGNVPNIGDVVEIWLDKLENSEGILSVSSTHAAQIRSWEKLEEIYKNRELVDGVITKTVRGGYIVSLLPYGAKAFLPSSQLDQPHEKEALQKLQVMKHPFCILKIDHKHSIVVSRKAVLLSDSSEAPLQGQT